MAYWTLDVYKRQHVDSTYIKVKSGKKEVKMPIEEYCIGILAKEIPASYDKEALKAQSVLDVYKRQPAL